MNQYRDTYAYIDLDRLKENIETCYNKVKKPLMAIIKANGYGHGAKEVALIAQQMDEIEMFGVATLREALDLREVFIKKDILVLGAVRKEDLRIASEYNITLNLLSKDYLLMVQSGHYSKPIKMHLKIDTAMNRLGLKNKEEIDEVLSLIDPQKVVLTGVFTHYACADEDESMYLKQFELYKELSKNLHVKYKHASNSAATLYYHEDYTNLARLGIGMYGVDPAGQESEELKQVMSLYTRVIMVKKIKKGEKIGYGLTYEANEDEYIATLPIGYADGITRANQGREVYIHGSYYPIVGRVCMDQMMVRVDENVQVGDMVEIFGDHISLARMAKELNTIPYEVICLLSERVERVYKQPLI